MIKFVDAALYKKEIKKLYYKAFPKNERAPLFYLYYKGRKGKADFNAVLDDDKFIGITFMTGTEDVVTLMFFAIKESYRGMGYGSHVLKTLQEKYAEKKIFLNIEPLEKTASNYMQRIKRKAFYEKNAFKSTGYTVHEAGVTYETLSFGGHVSKAECQAVNEKFFGKFLYFFISRF